MAPVRQVRTLLERQKIIEEVEKNPNEKRVDIAKRMGLAASTLNTIMARKDEILGQVAKYGKFSKHRKTGKASSFGDLETILFTWYQEARASNIPVNGPLLKEKAMKIATALDISSFRGSNGWIDRFRERHGMAKKLAAQTSTFDVEPVDVEATDKWMADLPDLLAGYAPCDIYGADETGLFFNSLPDKSLSLKREHLQGSRTERERMTILFCTNSNGSDKMSPVMIGTAIVEALPVQYHVNKHAWMSEDIFTSFLTSMDAVMGFEGRKVLLILKTCAVHPQDTSFLKNIRVIYYPKNCDRAVQPLAQGVIHLFKQLYRKKLVQKAVFMQGLGMRMEEIDLLQAINDLISSWNSITPQSITNCFDKCGYRSSECVQDEEIDEVFNEWDVYEGNAGVTFESYVSCDEDLATFGPTIRQENIASLCESVMTEGVKVEVEDEALEDEGEEDSEEDCMIIERVKEETVVKKEVPTFEEAEAAYKVFKSFVIAQGIAPRDVDLVTITEKILDDLKPK